MKLYFSPGACSLAVHIALREGGLAFELAAVDLATHRLADGSDYHAISPRGYVPLLQLDDGSRHTEAAALLQYVAETAPRQGLVGEPGSRRRFQILQWLTFVSSELHKVFSPWLWQKETAESTRAAVKDKLNTRFAELDAHLAHHEYLADEFSVADAYCFTIVNWANLLALPLKSYPNLQAYLTRVASRPLVREAMIAEGLAK
ncbi:MAG TPA: glutathione transferase GstA [Burkholderiaceae bacterium]|nr:glutathione transferase GstA [Burkholderiaceae bacterium]